MTPRLSKSTRRYLIIGVSVYLLEVAIILIGQRAGASAVASVTLAFWLGLLTSFLLQKVITFEDKNFEKHIVFRQMVAYGILIAWNYGFTILFTKLFQDLMPAVLCRTVALGFCTIWNFYLYKLHIFKSTEKGII
jgi:putative flippase GtrA